ncbi:MAG: hypothetical protein WA317_02905 [Mycobacterium sp.]|uniref:hypothetical protein n=1 Tax=Mycobacterium sp. TaxID=1785 RepID=UPI003CC6280E
MRDGWLDPPEKVKLIQLLDVIVDLARDSALELLNSRATPWQVQKVSQLGRWRAAVP